MAVFFVVTCMLYKVVHAAKATISIISKLRQKPTLTKWSNHAQNVLYVRIDEIAVWNSHAVTQVVKLSLCMYVCMDGVEKRLPRVMHYT